MLERIKKLREIIAESKWFCGMGKFSSNREVVTKFRLRRRVMEHRLKSLRKSTGKGANNG